MAFNFKILSWWHWAHSSFSLTLNRLFVWRFQLVLIRCFLHLLHLLQSNIWRLLAHSYAVFRVASFPGPYLIVYCAISPDLPFAHWRVVHTIFLAHLFRRQPRSLLLTDGSLSRNARNYFFGNIEFRGIEGFVFIVFGLGVDRFPVLLLFGTFCILFFFQFAYFLEQNVALFEYFLGFGFKKVFLGKILEFFVRHALFDEEFELVMLLITGNELFHEEQIRV